MRRIIDSNIEHVRCLALEKYCFWMTGTGLQCFYDHVFLPSVIRSQRSLLFRSVFCVFVRLSVLYARVLYVFNKLHCV